MAIASLSYGKDSIAMLYCIKQLGLPLDRIVHCEVWATDDLPADLPEMVDFKRYADGKIERLTGLKVEHIRAEKTFEQIFMSIRPNGSIYGWPGIISRWCTGSLKQAPLKKFTRGETEYIGIALDETKRLERLKSNKLAPLAIYGWTEADAMKWCQENGLVAPIYNSVVTRGGCWFCPFQRVDELRLLRHNHRQLWYTMLEWDEESKTRGRGKFFSHEKHLEDFDHRFWLEDNT